MRLIVDHRERKILSVVESIGLEVEVVQLPLGDILVIGDDQGVAIERKTASDFVGSMRSNRLWDQLLRFMTCDEIMGCKVKRRILLLHGSFRRYLSSRGRRSRETPSRFWASVSGAMLEVVFVYNTPIITVENDEALRSFLRILVQREENGKNDKTPEARWYRKPQASDLPVRDRRRFVLEGMPQIGETLALNLLEHFKSISEIANASLDELTEVKGIGEKKARLIYEVFH